MTYYIGPEGGWTSLANQKDKRRPLRWNDVRNGRTWEEMRAREEAQRAERPDLTATQPACESTGDAPTFELLNACVTICIIPQRVNDAQRCHAGCPRP